MASIKTSSSAASLSSQGFNLRARNIVRSYPIIYGSVSRNFGSKNELGHTHEWTIYVKPYYEEDMSRLVKKVHFKLHESYSENNRVVSRPPYQVKETGWGEFEAQIKLHFIDPLEKTVTIYHLLKLFHVDPEIKSGRKALVSEFYEEIVFQEPTAMILKVLDHRGTGLRLGNHHTDFEGKIEQEEALIHNAHAKIRSEIQEVSRKLKEKQDCISMLKEELEKEEAAVAMDTSS